MERYKVKYMRHKKFQGLKDQGLFASSLFLESHPELFKAIEGHKPSSYDKIMDQVYRETHIGGGTHRSFDGSHTFKGSYDKIKEVAGSVDLVEYLKSHFKEFVTPEGIPLFNLDKNRHEMISNEISESLGGNISPGWIRKYLRDFNSFDAVETATTGIGAVFLFLAIRSGNPKAISRVTAANICFAFATANLLLLFLGVAGLGHGLYHGKIKSYDLLGGISSVILGMTAYKTATSIFKISKSGAVISSIGATVLSEALFSHLERKRKEKVLKELGKNNSHYIAALTPDILSREIMRFSRKDQKLALGSLI